MAIEAGERLKRQSPGEQERLDDVEPSIDQSSLQRLNVTSQNSHKSGIKSHNELIAMPELGYMNESLDMAGLKDPSLAHEYDNEQDEESAREDEESAREDEEMVNEAGK